MWSVILWRIDVNDIVNVVYVINVINEKDVRDVVDVVDGMDIVDEVDGSVSCDWTGLNWQSHVSSDVKEEIRSFCR